MPKRFRTPPRTIVRKKERTDNLQKTTFIKQNSKKGTLKDLSVDLIKKRMFPETCIYQNPCYPQWISCLDSAFAGNTATDFYDNRATYVPGTLRISQTANTTTSVGSQMIAQFADLTQMEFAQLSNKLAYDDKSVMNSYGSIVDITKTDPEDQTSPWFRYRQLFLEQYDSTYKFTNTSNLSCNVEIICWKPRDVVFEALQSPNDPLGNYANNTPLGCINQDYYASPSQTYFGNTEEPLNVKPTFSDSILQPSTIRLVNKGFIKTNKMYMMLDRKTIILGPGESINYNVSIPSQMLSNHSKAMSINSYTAVAGTWTVGAAWRTFSRFITVRAWSNAIIDNETTVSNANKGAFTYGDVSLAVVNSKYIKLRNVPFYQRTQYINSTTSNLNWNGNTISSLQYHDVVTGADQHFQNVYLGTEKEEGDI